MRMLIVPLFLAFGLSACGEVSCAVLQAQCDECANTTEKARCNRSVQAADIGRRPEDCQKLILAKTYEKDGPVCTAPN